MGSFFYVPMSPSVPEVSFFYVPMSPSVPEVRDLKHWGACTFEFLDVVFTFMPSESLL